MSVNVQRYDADLRAAGLAIVGCSSTGRVEFCDGTAWEPGVAPATVQDRTAAVVYARHDPTPTPEQRLARAGFSPLLAAIVLVAKESPLAPAWAKAIVDDAAAQIRDARGEV